MIYQVHARKWAKGWELHIDGVGVTQSKTLAKAACEASDYLCSQLNQEKAAVNLQIEIGPVIDEIAQLRELQKRVEDEQKTAASEARRIAKELRETGFSVSDIAAILEVSRGRVSQLVS